MRSEDAHHHLHVVLDQQHGDSHRPDVGELGHEAFGLHRVHAGDRLIQQQEFRLRSERDGDFEQALLAVRQGRSQARLFYCPGK